MKNYILCIGIGQYEHQGDEIKSLGRVPLNDIERLSRVLLDELYGFELVLDPLINEAASSNAVLAALEKLEELDEDAQVIVFFSGHGHYLPELNMSYWLAHDAVRPSGFSPYIEPEGQGWISAEKVVEKINAIGCRHTLVLADCCFSGHLVFNFRGLAGEIYPEYAKFAVRTRSKEVLTPCGMTAVSTATGSISVSSFIDKISCRLETKDPYAVICPQQLFASLLPSLKSTPQYGHLQEGSEPGGCFLFTSPRRLDEILKEPCKSRNLLHHVLCRKIEQQLKPINYEVDKGRFLGEFVGREWVFDEIDQWITSEKTSLFWLLAEAGVGKSAISSYLATHNPLITAHHFFSYSKSSTLDGAEIVKSIACQLSTSLPEYAKIVSQLELDSVLGRDDITMFDELIISPLSKIRSPEMPVVLLFDGLDELSSNGRNVIAEHLAAILREVPEWLKIIITSRPREPELLRPLASYKPWFLNAGDSRNLNDIRTFLEKRDVGDSMPEELVAELITKSEGSFLYITYFCDEWKSSASSLGVGNLPSGLSGLYDVFFRRKYWGRDFNSMIAPLLEILVGVCEPISTEELAHLSGISKRDTEGFLRISGALLTLKENRVEFWHKSISDWLIADKKSEFYICVDDCHKRLSALCFTDYSNRDTKTTKYTLKFLFLHLVRAKLGREQEILLLDWRYLEEKTTFVGVYELLSELYLYGGGNKIIHELRVAIQACCRFLDNDPQGLFQCICINLHEYNLEALKSSDMFLDWCNAHHAKNVLRVEYSSTSRSDDVFTLYVERRASALLYADDERVVVLDKSQLLVLQTLTGKTLVQYKLNLGRSSVDPVASFAHGNVVFLNDFTDELNILNLKSGETKVKSMSSILRFDYFILRIKPGQKNGIIFICAIDWDDNEATVAYDMNTDVCEDVFVRMEEQGKEIFNHELYKEYVYNPLYVAKSDSVFNDPVIESTVSSAHSFQNYICAGDAEGFVYVWCSGELVYKDRVFFSRVEDMYVIPQLGRIVIFSSHEKELVVKDFRRPVSEKFQLELLSEEIRSMTFTKDGDYLLIAAGCKLFSFNLCTLRISSELMFDKPIVHITGAEEDGHKAYALSGDRCFVVFVPALFILEEFVIRGGKPIKIIPSNEYGIFVLHKTGITAYNEITGARFDLFLPIHPSIKSQYYDAIIHGKYLYASCSDGIREHNVDALSEYTTLESSGIRYNKIALLKNATFLLSIPDDSLLVRNLFTGEVIQRIPYFEFDFMQCVPCLESSVLCSDENGSMLFDFELNNVRAKIPWRFSIVRKHPVSELWAASSKNRFAILNSS